MSLKNSCGRSCARFATTPPSPQGGCSDDLHRLCRRSHPLRREKSRMPAALMKREGAEIALVKFLQSRHVLGKHSPTKVALRKAGRVSEPSRENAALQRNTHDDADILLLREREEPLLGILMQDVVYDLNRVGLAGLDRDDCISRGRDRYAVGADFAFPFEPLEPLEDLPAPP